jgi:hypothetical protein
MDIDNALLFQLRRVETVVISLEESRAESCSYLESYLVTSRSSAPFRGQGHRSRLGLKCLPHGPGQPIETDRSYQQGCRTKRLQTSAAFVSVAMPLDRRADRSCRYFIPERPYPTVAASCMIRHKTPHRFNIRRRGTSSGALGQGLVENRLTWHRRFSVCCTLPSSVCSYQRRDTVSLVLDFRPLRELSSPLSACTSAEHVSPRS